MTFEEKAEELVNKMYYSRRYDNTENYLPDRAWEHSKQCALIVVDEVIKQNNVWIEQVGKGTNNYWLEVKKEIEKL
jgi:hypothetical protein